MMTRVFHWHTDRLTHSMTPDNIISDWIIAPSGGKKMLMCFTGRPAELQFVNDAPTTRMAFGRFKV